MVSAIKWILLLLVPVQVWADLMIFDVRRNLPMADGETVYRDFIINGGSEAGLSVGMILTVQRRMPLYDSYQNRSAGDLQLKVARIKIIYVQKGLAVARLHAEFTRESTPLIEDNFVMVGDQIDLGSATSDKKAESSSANDSSPQAAAHGTRAQAQIVVNSVDLSSHGNSPTPTTQQKVDVPVLQ